MRYLRNYWDFQSMRVNGPFETSRSSLSTERDKKPSWRTTIIAAVRRRAGVVTLLALAGAGGGLSSCVLTGQDASDLASAVALGAAVLEAVEPITGEEGFFNGYSRPIRSFDLHCTVFPD